MFHYDFYGKTLHKKLLYNTILIMLILIAGLRYRLGIDTQSYMAFFDLSVDGLGSISNIDFSTGKYDPCFVIFCSIVKTFFNAFWVVQLIQATILNTLIFKYIIRHTQYIFTAVLFYFILFYLQYNMEIMRAAWAIIICLYAFDYARNKKWLKCYALIIIASFFHFSAIIMLFIPLFLKIKFNKTTMTVLIFVAVFGIVFQQYFYNIVALLTYSNRLSSKFDSYSDSIYFTQMFNINGFISLLIQYVIVPFISINYLKSIHSKVVDRLESMVFFCSFFSVLSIPVAIMYRYAQFFYFPIYIVMAEALNCYIQRSTRQVAINKIFLFLFVTTYLVFPVFLSFNHKDIDGQHSTMSRYYPYSSIIEKSKNEDRESIYRVRADYYIDDSYYKK